MKQALGLVYLLFAAHALAESNGGSYAFTYEHDHPELEGKVDLLQSRIDRVTESMRTEFRERTDELERSIAARAEEPARSIDQAAIAGVAADLSGLEQRLDWITYIGGALLALSLALGGWLWSKVKWLEDQVANSNQKVAGLAGTIDGLIKAVENTTNGDEPMPEEKTPLVMKIRKPGKMRPIDTKGNFRVELYDEYGRNRLLISDTLYDRPESVEELIERLEAAGAKIDNWGMRD